MMVLLVASTSLLVGQMIDHDASQVESATCSQYLQKQSPEALFHFLLSCHLEV